MKPLISTFAVALIICASTAAVAQPPAPPMSSDPTALNAKSQAEIRRIVDGRAFRIAARSRNIARMNNLLKGTGVVVANPVALFYCRPPHQAIFKNGAWYCEGGGTSVKVHPFMYN